jgi:hypothetical protein
MKTETEKIEENSRIEKEDELAIEKSVKVTREPIW